MESNNPNYTYDSVVQLDDSETASRKYLAKVFAWMFVALGISAFFALEFYSNSALTSAILVPATDGTGYVGFTGLGYICVFAPLAFSLVMSFGFNRISYPVMVFLLLAYSATIGISLSVLGFEYTAGSIFGVFLSAAVVFGVMAITGYTTSMDLSKFGSIIYMIFIGAFVASLVNFFIGSAQLDYIISFIFIAVMVGLTAYYMQMLKRIGAGIEYGNEQSKKLVIIGAFILYTTFINLFISMMRIFGRRR
ncbi:MAG: Bax inhibitor-1 family protein [Sphingobacteriales bacterium]